MSAISKPLYQVAQQLVDVAMGREGADTIITNGRVVNVCSGEIHAGFVIAIKAGRVAFLGPAEELAEGARRGAREIDAEDMYLVPGFLDAHEHIESSLMRPREFAKAVIPHGTTTVFYDSHEIGNVLGDTGIRWMQRDLDRTLLKGYSTYPSCVPATAEQFETSGARIGPEEVAEAMTWPETIALGEMMNYPGVIFNDPKVHGEIAATLQAEKVVEGHSHSLLGKELNAFAAAGITSCHESITKQDCLERVRAGLYTYLRQGSGWPDVKDTVRAVTEAGIDSRRICLCTDDRHAGDLVEAGHVDEAVRMAIVSGVRPVEAIQMVTLNPVTHYRLDHEVGSITPGRLADIVFLSDLPQVRVERVMIEGIFFDEWKEEAAPVDTSPVTDTVHIGHKLTPEDFTLASEGTLHVIGLRNEDVRTDHLAFEVEPGEVEADPSQDLLKCAVIERHTTSGRIGLGMVKGFGIREGAYASTVGHDAHNLIVIGTNDEDMATAANRLAEISGGLIVVVNGQTRALLELPIAGLMSEESAETVAQKVRQIEETLWSLGATLNHPFMNFSLVPLAVIESLRLTDRGLIDTEKFELIT
ncbi:MAG: adenine deaminase [Candidatus Bipolaricaulia bacterium]